MSGWRSLKRLGLSILWMADLAVCLQQAFNPKIAGSFGSRPKLGGPFTSAFHTLGKC